MADSFDAIAPNFRKAMEHWSGAATLRAHYDAVNQCHCGNTHGLVVTAKSFIECVCITILNEYGAPVRPAGSTTELLVECMDLLGLKNSRDAGSLSKILTAHNKLADALSDMRNHNCPVAHGKDGFLDALTTTQLRAYLLTSDTLLAIVLAALEGTEPDLKFTREPYERFVHLHRRIDRSVTVECSILTEAELPTVMLTIQTPSLREGIELRVEPSRLLFAIDRTAYIELLGASIAGAGEDASAATIGLSLDAMPVGAPAAPLVTAREGMTHPATGREYRGNLSSHRSALGKHLATLGVPGPAPPATRREMVNSLLAAAEQSMGVDWTEREAMRARMRVALRRTFAEYGIADQRARDWADRLVTWLRSKAAPQSQS